MGKSKAEMLASWFGDKRGVIVALSGGVDSALVAHAAFSSLGGSAVAVTADYRTLSSEELGSARLVAREIGIDHVIISYDELGNPDFVMNDRHRCFHCRSELAARLQDEARARGVPCIVDGTNADDLGDYRPGIAALRDGGIRSPLAEVGMAKGEIRAAAREAGLSVHDKPSNACLASRVPWGQRITAERLARIDLAERFIRAEFGVRQVRVRDMGGTARIEVMPADIRKIRLGEAAISSRLGMIGFSASEIDPVGYRQGGTNAAAPAAGEEGGR